MHISKVVFNGFRNLNGEVSFNAPLAAIVGENNAGKSNLIDGLRLVLNPGLGPHESLYPRAEDFRHDGHGIRQVDEFSIDVHLESLSVPQQGRLLTCLTPAAGHDTAMVGLRCQIDTEDRLRRVWVGGDHENVGVETWARTAVAFHYLPPLRDAESDLRPGRSNRLASLVSNLAPPANADRTTIETVMVDANTALQAVPSITRAGAQIQQRLGEILGPIYGKKTRIVFADPRFEQIISTLRALIGELEPLEMRDGGLGYNNLLYMATLLASLGVSTEAELNVVLVEEPEAHLHPQLQDLLMRFLESSASPSVQIVMTTHSPSLTSTSGVSRITRLHRTDATTVTALNLSTVDLATKDEAYLRRFLDVTKAQMLFARSVMFVEGIAEQLLMPSLARSIGTDLHEYGVSIVNVSGLAFRPFAAMFAEGALPVQCALVSDSDPTVDADGIPVISATAATILEMERGATKPFLADRTFEWDLVRAGNWDTCIAALGLEYPQLAAGLQADDPGDATARADAFLAKLDRRKGPFAQALAWYVDENELNLVVPEYLRLAIEWVTPPLLAEEAGDPEAGHPEHDEHA